MRSWMPRPCHGYRFVAHVTAAFLFGKFRFGLLQSYFMEGIFEAILERPGWQFARIRGTAFYRNPDLSMRPVFDRLAELDIPPESLDAEPPVTDMTFVYELEALIAEGFDNDATLDESPGQLETAADESESESTSGPLVFEDGQVEALLKSLGGMAPLEDFLRQFAKSKGFRRLGRNVSKGLESELAKLMHAGKLVMDRGVIWIK